MRTRSQKIHIDVRIKVFKQNTQTDTCVKMQ